MTPTTQMTAAECVARLRELSHAITQGRETMLREFTMRVPAEPKRDADLVLATAADLLEREVARADRQQELYEECDMKYQRLQYRTEHAERELAEIRGRLEKAPRVTFRLGYAEGLFEVDSVQEEHSVPTGQRVAIVPLLPDECQTTDSPGLRK